MGNRRQKGIIEGERLNAAGAEKRKFFQRARERIVTVKASGRVRKFREGQERISPKRERTT